MEENNLFITTDSITLIYYGFRIMILRKWFATCGINDFRKCMKTLKWACSDDPKRFITVITNITVTISIGYPDIVVALDKKVKVLRKYREELEL